jgi:hypothetical protein
MARRKGSPRLSPETLERMRNDSGRVYRDTFRPAPGRVIPPAGSGRNFNPDLAVTNPRGSFNYNAADEALARGRQAATMRAADEAAAQARGQQDANTLSNYAQLLERLNASKGTRRPRGGRNNDAKSPAGRGKKPGGGRNNDAKSPAGRGKGKAGRGKGKDFERMLRSRMSRY